MRPWPGSAFARPWPVPDAGSGILVQHASDSHIGYRSWSYGECDHVLDDHLDNLVPRPDLFVMTGDITDHGADAEDAYAIRWLNRLARGAPSLWAIGNHDLRSRRFITRVEWERIYRRPGNTFTDVKGTRFVVFSVDQFTGNSASWVIPEATWSWLDQVIGSALGPVVLVDHYPPQEIGVEPFNVIQPASRFDELIGDHPQVIGMLSGHMHLELTDPRANAFLEIGGRKIPSLCDISSMLSLGLLGRDQSAQIQSHTAWITMEENRWIIRYRAHGSHLWDGPEGWRSVTLDLASQTRTLGW